MHALMHGTVTTRRGISNSASPARSRRVVVLAIARTPPAEQATYKKCKRSPGSAFHVPDRRGCHPDDARAHRTALAARPATAHLPRAPRHLSAPRTRPRRAEGKTSRFRQSRGKGEEAASTVRVRNVYERTHAFYPLGGGGGTAANLSPRIAGPPSCCSYIMAAVPGQDTDPTARCHHPSTRPCSCSSLLIYLRDLHDPDLAANISHTSHHLLLELTFFLSFLSHNKLLLS
jgi:hypothetical protein